MSHIYSDENQLPSFFNDSKKRQSCPAQVQLKTFEMPSQILGDSTNMRKSFIDSQMTFNPTSQKESVSSRYSEPIYSTQDLMGPSLQSKSQLRQSLVRNSIIEEESSQSKMRSSSIFGDPQNQNQNQQNLCQDNAVSKRSSVNSKMSKEITIESQCDQETMNTLKNQITQSSEKKKQGIFSKILILVLISLLAFLIVFSAKFFFAKGNFSGVFQQFSSEDYQLKNKYFEEQIFGEKNNHQQKPTQAAAPIPDINSLTQQKDSTKQKDSKKIAEQEKYQQPAQVETKNIQRQSSEPNTVIPNKQDTIPQLSKSKQEKLIKEESEQFFNVLVKLVQKDKQINYQTFEEMLTKNCTPAILEKVKAQIQNLVNESDSIKEELNIETGTRHYVSLEKY